MNRLGAVGRAGIFLIALGVLLLVIGSLRSAPPPQCTLPPRDDTVTDARLAVLERRVAELCERLDRPAAQATPSVAAGLEVQSAPPAAYTAVCRPNGCQTGPTPSFAYPAFQGGFIASGGSMGIPIGSGGGCAGGSCGAAAPAGGLLRGGLFRGRR
jgi:hypothetical protein